MLNSPDLNFRKEAEEDRKEGRREKEEGGREGKEGGRVSFKEKKDVCPE